MLATTKQQNEITCIRQSRKSVFTNSNSSDMGIRIGTTQLTAVKSEQIVYVFLDHIWVKQCLGSVLVQYGISKFSMDLH